MKGMRLLGNIRSHALLLLPILALASRPRDAYSQEQSDSDIREELAKIERVVSSTVHKNQALEKEIRALRLQLGLPRNAPPSAQTMWQQATEIGILLDQAQKELEVKAAVQEALALKDQIAELESYAENVNSELLAKPRITEFSTLLAPLQSKSDALQKNIDVLERDLLKVYFKSSEWLTQFSSNPDIDWG
jgi:hypothetical protein